MRQASSHDPRRRKRVADNLYRRRTLDGRDVYEVKFRDVDGKFRSRTLGATSERHARKEARTILAGRDAGKRVAPAEMTLREFAEREYFPLIQSLAAAGRRSERNVDDSRDRWRTHLEPTLGALRLGGVQPRHVADVVRTMRRSGKAEGTIAGVLVVLRAMYRLVRSRSYVAGSPVDGLDPAETPRPRVGGAGRILDEAELTALVRHCPEQYKPVVTVLAFSGLRLAEALGLRWRDVDFVEQELHVRQQLQPARGKVGTPSRREAKLVRLKTSASERDVPMFPAVEAALIQLADARQRIGGAALGDELVFVTRTGSPLTHRNVAQRGVAAAAASAGLGKLTPHDLRRSFCSLAGRRGVDPVEAAQITGHSPAVWARFYARSFGKAQRDEARQRLLEHGFGAEG